MTKTKMVACDLCGSTNCDFLFNAKDRLHGCDGAFTYVQCKKCGLVYMNPQILPDDIGKFYPPDYGPHQAKQKRQQLDKQVLKRKCKRRPFVASICNKLTQDRRLLDVGCGNGSFLNEIKTMTGCQVCGVDISRIAAKTAKEIYGLNISTGTILESPFPNGYFDVVTAWQYLEHVNNPAEVVQKISNLLKAEGSCIISSPNFDSFTAQLFKDRWYPLDCPRHLYIYTPETINAFLGRSGLSIQEIKYTGSSKYVLGSLQYYLYGDNYNPKYRDRIKKSSLLRMLVSPCTRIAAIIKRSDIMVIHAKKSI